MSLHIFLVAGEPSGDVLGAALMQGLRSEVGDAVRFSGVGGPLMDAEGLTSLFAQDDLAVMGLVEVLPRLPRLLRRIAETREACLAARPDALVTIDSPSFGLRVARGVRRAAPELPLVHYVAPSVWAWRPGRAKRLAGEIDHLLALLPFEPPLFTSVGLGCTFVGHPAAALAPAPDADVAALRARLGLGGDDPVLLALPGSRTGELRRHMAPFAAVLDRLKAARPDLRVVLPTLPSLEQPVRAATADWPVTPIIVAPAGADAGAQKRAAFALADVALAASGTVTLELAAAGVPMVAVYRAHPLTAAIVRRLVRVDTANLVNLVDGSRVVPEFLQERFVPEDVARELLRLLDEPEARSAQIAAASRVMTALGRGGIAPGRRAARAVLSVMTRADQRFSTST